jgi:hypothetical protein
MPPMIRKVEEKKEERCRRSKLKERWGLSLLFSASPSRERNFKHVFGCIVVVDVQITVGADCEGPAGVFGEGVEHVVEEADAGVEGYLLGLSCVVRFWEGDGEVGG